MAVEEWRPIEGWPYEVSDRGRVRRATAARGTRARRIMNPPIGSHGYPCVVLFDNPRSAGFTVHSLVAGAFLPPPPGPIGTGADCYQVNHRDGIKTNNAVANLEWVTRTENARHAARAGLTSRGVLRYNAKLSPPKVRAIREMLASGHSQSAAASRFGVHPGTIQAIADRKTWRHVA